MAKRYRVTLAAAERDALDRMLSRGRAAARKLAHARVLLLADASAAGPGWTDAAIAEAVRVSVRTIERVRQRFVEEGLEAALRPKPSQRVYRGKLDGEQEAKPIALACSSPPEGKKRWTLRLPPRRQGRPDAAGGRLAAPAQCDRRQSRLAIHYDRGSHQITQALPDSRGLTDY